MVTILSRTGVLKAHSCCLLLTLFLVLIQPQVATIFVPVVAGSYQLHDPIQIDGNGEFTLQNGVVAGTGTSTDPYVIEGWEIIPPSGSCTKSDGTETCTSPSKSGIGIRDTTASVIIRNVYIHSGGINSCAICLENVANARVEDSIVSQNWRGIQTYRTFNITVSENTVDRNFLGIHIRSLDTTVENNQAIDNSILVEQSFGVKIRNNTVQASGIYVHFSHFATISENRIIGNSQDYAVILQESSQVQVYNNGLFSNRTGTAYDTEGTENWWDAGFPAGGNYWSDYSGDDRCTGPAQDVCTGPDGIGDTPYTIDSDSADRYPLMKPQGLPLDQGSPTWPADAHLRVVRVNSSSVYLTWPAASDTSGMVRYRVSQNDTTVAVIVRAPGRTTSYTANGLVPASTYVFRVEAGDPSDNWSQSLSMTITLEGTATTPTNPYLALALAVIIALVAIVVLASQRRVTKKDSTATEQPSAPVSSGFIGERSRGRSSFVPNSGTRTR